MTFSRAGTAVFVTDLKGDLAGITMPGDSKSRFAQRAKDFGIAYAAADFRIAFWDLQGQSGHAVRARISEMGLMLLARMLELNNVQEGVLNIAFRLAGEKELLLIDLKDLKALLQHLGENAAEATARRGNVAPATIGAILRRLLGKLGHEWFSRRTRARHKRFSARRVLPANFPKTFGESRFPSLGSDNSLAGGGAASLGDG